MTETRDETLDDGDSPSPWAARRRTMAGAAGIALALALVLLAAFSRAYEPRQLSGDPPRFTRMSDAASALLPATPPPPVEPLVLAAIPVEDARAINARIPFVSGPFAAAKAFRFAGDPLQRARAVDCLAAAMLYEAGDDAAGQRAVGQVVLNRARHPAFPKTVCGVVFQGSERRTGCQFTFTCDGSLVRRYSAAAWDRARGLAGEALGGAIDKRVGLATHYHTDWVVPYWSDTLDKLAAVDTHLFFRWKGAWGTPPAFRTRISGDEPVIAKLAAISPAHAPALALAEVDAGDDVAARAAPATTAKVYEDTIFVAAPPAATPASLKALALAQCGARDYCKLFGWTDRALVPADGELSAAARKSMAFSYLRDRKSGFERALFDCGVFAALPANACMKTL